MRTCIWKLATMGWMVVTLTIANATAQMVHSGAGGAVSEDRPSTHNMLLIGKEAAFLSHLPMFDSLNKKRSDYSSPHRYQVILEVKFSADGKDLTDLYTRDRKAHPKTKIYTVNPTSEFVLPSFFGPDPQKPALNSFRATVFRGHLERGGQPIDGLKDVVVTVESVLQARKFEPSDAKPKKLQYYLFGRGEELFLAHTIVKPPDFDQVIAVNIANSDLTQDDLRRGVTVVFQDRANTVGKRLKENQQAQGRFHVTGSHRFHDLRVQAVAEYYFEQGELAMPANFAPTTEERNAGF